MGQLVPRRRPEQSREDWERRMLSHIRFYKTARVIVLAFGLLLVLLAGALYLTAQDPGGSAVMAVPR